MARRALLIGAQTFGLKGVDQDVATMAAALTNRGFDIRCCEGPKATRDGILGAYRQFIVDTEAGDAVVVYYSGHGGYARPLPGETVEVASNDRQFIVPWDFRKPTPDDFRGITAVELSVLLAQLSQRTDNAVVVLDCCHSGMMSRALGRLRVRQLPEAVLVDLDAHRRRQVAAGLPVHLAKPDGNPLSVRMVACADDQLAHEDGPEGGLFTQALIQALDEMGETRVSWARLVARIRELVQTRSGNQRPMAEGPASRVLFEAQDDDRPGSLPVVVSDGVVRLEGARLLGVQRGDEFAIMPASAAGPDDEGRIATVRVSEVELTAATGRPRYTVRRTTMPPDARAFRTSATAPLIPVRVPAALAAEVDRTGFVRMAEPGESALLDVRESADGALTVCDSIGPLHQPRLPGTATVRLVMADLNRVARAIVLRRLRDQSTWCPAPQIMLDWGRVDDGKPYELPRGATVTAGDLVYLRVRNSGVDQVFMSLLDIGVSYAITQLTDMNPTGVRLTAGGEYVFGSGGPDGLPAGRQLIWPSGLDQGAVRPETVLVLVTDKPHHLGPLLQPGVRGRGPDAGPLDNLLAYFGGNATREFADPAKLHVDAFEFNLEPAGRA
jgi:Caspase domain